MFQYLVYDVFTDTVFGGNQLAVFPDARHIPEDKLQSITAEFNFSEATFVYPPEDATNTARVRIFTPTAEVDFAGHPLIGTLIALSGLGYSSPMVLEIGVGPLTGTVSNLGAAFTAVQILERIEAPDMSLVAQALGLPREAICTRTHTPIQASLGFPFVLVELNHRSDLSACRPSIPTIRDGAEIYSAGNDFAIFAYVREGNEINSRMFAPLDNIPEDPATGSASATLAVLLTDILDTPLELTFTQGVDMGRPSKIKARTTQDPVTVTIEGQAVKVMAGELFL